VIRSAEVANGMELAGRFVRWPCTLAGQAWEEIKGGHSVLFREDKGGHNTLLTRKSAMSPF
jgi:hypothetical protein